MLFKRLTSNKGSNKFNKNKTIENYFNKLDSPSSCRKDSDKYYIEMQLLAFQLNRYLGMNNDKNEHGNQGNWNWTFFRENLSDKSFQELANRVLGEMTHEQWYEAEIRWKRKAPFRNLEEILEDDDIGDSYMRIIYKPIGTNEIKRIIKKIEMKDAMNEIAERIEVEYIKTEHFEYKEKNE